MSLERLFSHPQSWPTRSLSMSRDYFNAHKDEALALARRYGYVIRGATERDPEAKLYHASTVGFLGSEA